MHKLTILKFILKIYKNQSKQGIKSNEKLHNLKCAFTDNYHVYLLIISTFNGNIESIVMEMALTEMFCSYYINKMCKDSSLLIGNFHY